MTPIIVVTYLGRSSIAIAIAIVIATVITIIIMISVGYDSNKLCCKTVQIRLYFAVDNATGIIVQCSQFCIALCSIVVSKII